MADLVRSVVDRALGLLAVEQRGSLFERETLGLDDEEVQERELKREPAAVDNVVLPAKLAKRDRVDVLVEDEGQRDDEVEDVEALGTECERQDFDRVRDDERREGETRGGKKSVSDY